MKKTSIRLRMILAMDLLVVAVGVCVGALAIRAAGREIERKLVFEAVSNAAALIRETNLPISSDALLQRVGRILGAEVAAGPAGSDRLDASSLSPAQRQELAAQLSGQLQPHHVRLGGKAYRVAATSVQTRAGAAALVNSRLYVLVAQDRIEAAKRTAAWDIALATVGAIAAATVLAVFLSFTISRPIGRLVRRMDELSTQAQSPASAQGAGESPPASALQAVGRHSPRELARLADSFDRLMGQLAKARAEVARSAGLATLGKLAASVAHELRNPLSGIRMNAQVLAEELGKAGQVDPSLPVIIREIDRIDLYLQEMLSLASAAGRSEGGAEPVEQRRPVRLDELADSVAELLSGRCGHAGVTIRREYDPAAPAVQAEPNRIRQVLLNLMLNAMEAAPSGGSITLAVRPIGSKVRFSVTDTGPGVPEGIDVFEPFVTTRPEGAGLGLYICRQIIQSHGGQIGYDTSPAGATFWFEVEADKETQR